MSKSSTIRPGDGRAIINLIGECRELGDDWACWQEHWIAGLLDLTDAELGIGGELGDTHGPRFRQIGQPAMQGQRGFPADPSRVLEILEGYTAVPGESDFASKYFDAMKKDDGLAATNRVFFGDRDWRASTDMQIVGQAYGTDSVLICCRRLPRARADESLNVTFFRAKGRRNFAARDCAVVREAVAAITPLIGGPLARFEDPSPARLAPRVRQVLACFLDGESDKQVAARLGISIYTVNQYAKVIFQHFGVRSRTELLARWVRRGWGGKFPWAH